jgi:hypothetical protein
MHKCEGFISQKISWTIIGGTSSLRTLENVSFKKIFCCPQCTVFQSLLPATYCIVLFSGESAARKKPYNPVLPTIEGFFTLKNTSFAHFQIKPVML